MRKIKTFLKEIKEGLTEARRHLEIYLFLQRYFGRSRKIEAARRGLVDKLVSRLLSKTIKVSVILMLLGILLVLEPSLRGKVSFAVPHFGGTQNGVMINQGVYLTTPFKTTPTIPQKTHAPEPSTFLLLLGGISGVIVRYVRQGFDKIKRLMDIVLSLTGLVVTSPILLFGSILIKLDSPGAVVYRQKRVGKNGKIFTIYKLRSMTQNAEKGVGAVWAKKNDARVTTIGRILRKSRIDEIPQLLNVLRGDMSIVGPRPERPAPCRSHAGRAGRQNR